MARDKIKPLKMETPSEGTQLNFAPTEADPTQDFLDAKGVTFEGQEIAVIESINNKIALQDSETVVASLKDAIDRIARKDVDLANLVNGYVLTWNSVTSKFELQSPMGAGGGSGVTPPFVLSKDGNCTVGTALRTGVVPTNLTGQTIDGTNKIVKLGVSTSANVGSTTRIQITRRTGLATFVDIPNAYIVIPAGTYKAVSIGLDINIGPNYEIGAYNKSGSTTNNIVFMIYLIPA